MGKSYTMKNLTPEDAIRISEQDEKHIANIRSPVILEEESKEEKSRWRDIKNNITYHFDAYVVSGIVLLFLGISIAFFVDTHNDKKARENEIHKMLDVELKACEAKCESIKMKTEVVRCNRYEDKYNNEVQCFCKDEFGRPISAYVEKRGERY